MLRIGKNPTNDLVIKDRAAEDFHCILYISNTELIVEDLKSHYGTLVNGTKVSHAILYPGDELQIGFTRIEWQKLMPALQAIGDTSDAENFLESQDLNLEVRDDVEIQSSDNTFTPSDYTIDSTAELIEKALNLDNLKELEYAVTVQKGDSEDAENKLNESSLVDEVLQITPEDLVESTSINNARLDGEIAVEYNVKVNKASNPYKQYYLILAVMLTVMVLTGLAIAYITG